MKKTPGDKELVVYYIQTMGNDYEENAFYDILIVLREQFDFE